MEARRKDRRKIHRDNPIILSLLPALLDPSNYFESLVLCSSTGLTAYKDDYDFYGKLQWAKLRENWSLSLSSLEVCSSIEESKFSHVKIRFTGACGPRIKLCLCSVVNDYYYRCSFCTVSAS